MPPPPSSPLLLRGSLHPVRGGPYHFQTSRLSHQITPLRSPSLPLTAPTALSLPLSRPLSTTPSAHSGDSHGPHYDEPQGWLFGVPPGQKYEKEGWEGIWVWGFWGSLAFGAVGYAYKPDTSIQTWALEEARRRLEIEGILEDPFPALPLASASATEGEAEVEFKRGS